MQLQGNTILITGGATGIGFALAQRFVAHHNTVIICGRREDALAHAKTLVPQLITRVCDLEHESERIGLVSWVTTAYPDCNVLINNAGMQRTIDIKKGESWSHTKQELTINLEAPIHLCMQFASHMRDQAHGVIINVTSGLAFAPLARVPVYCATKAAMHSFTLSLRHQLAPRVEVIEIQPPAVNTDLGGPGQHTFGMDVQAFADAVLEGLSRNEQEIAVGFSKELSRASRDELDALFARMNPL